MSKFQQTTTPGRWKDADGTVHRMVDMDFEYIYSCLKFCVLYCKEQKLAEFVEELRDRMKTKEVFKVLKEICVAVCVDVTDEQIDEYLMNVLGLQYSDSDADVH